MIIDERIWNTGKVKIGIHAKTRDAGQDADADLLQRALLAGGPRRVDWDNVVVLASILGATFMVVASFAGWLPGGGA